MFKFGFDEVAAFAPEWQLDYQKSRVLFRLFRITFPDFFGEFWTWLQRNDLAIWAHKGGCWVEIEGLNP